ncbi:MAG TPA: PDZ domain-containing protein [Terriglobales bacterium]|nr:PDZ domain-containing protein [Terriglobales bacterium]
MSAHSSGLRRPLLLAFLLLLCTHASAQYPCPSLTSNGQVGSGGWSYIVALQDPARHLLHVTISINPTSADLQVQLPVWNALYQVRDFAEHVNWLRATDAQGRPVPMRQADKTTWSAPNATTIEYEIFAGDPGPFGAELDEKHAFLNLAQVLVYPIGHKQGRVEVSFSGLPENWRIATPLQGPDPRREFCADSYDHLVDSPVEIGTFREYGFDEGGARYRLVVDTDESYRSDLLVDSIKKIVTAETEWMADRPFEQYTFIYHLPHGMGRGGMEHAYSAAIETSAVRLAEDPVPFESVSAHEFFHLWNVKRIRPQSLEPIDYTKENYTRALWFSEGVDSTVAEYMLARAGLIGEDEFLERLASQVRELESRPADKTQSVEQSSLNTWLEKYPYYRSPQRSINYYNKGLIVGVLLDLAMRDRTHGQKSLRDLFRWMNQHYAKEGKYFEDSEGVRQAAEAVTGSNFDDFFKRYVSGTDSIPYNDFFASVGLQLERKQTRVAYAGFTANGYFGATPVVTSVDAGSEAEKAGLHPGDIVLSMNGMEPASNLDQAIISLQPGSTLRLKVSTRDRVHEIRIKLAAREDIQFEFRKIPDATAEQVSRRRAWMRGDPEEAH